jgi:RHS repeat-associated protein
MAILMLQLGAGLQAAPADGPPEARYDALGRLVEAHPVRNEPTTRIRFLYDADGNRSARELIHQDPESGRSVTNRTRLLIDVVNPSGVSQVLAQFESDGSFRASLIGQQPAAEVLADGSASARQFYLATDGHGSTRLVDPGPDEPVANAADYDAFGCPLPGSTAVGRATHLYAGEPWDALLGTQWLRSRDYLPSQGRFLTGDTYEGSLPDPASRHRYSYCHGEPVDGVDPSGHEFSVSGLYYGIGARLFLAGTAITASYPHMVHWAQGTVTAVTLGSLILSEDARLAFLATGNPAAATADLAGDVGLLFYRGGRVIQETGSSLARAAVIRRVEQPLAEAAGRIRSVDPDAVVGFRGSVASGIRHSTKDLFDPATFDLDGFIVSDRLAAAEPEAWFRTGRAEPAVTQEAKAIDNLLRGAFEGYRGGPRQPFTFRVWTTEEYRNRIAKGPHVTF